MRRWGQQKRGMLRAKAGMMLREEVCDFKNDRSQRDWEKEKV